MHRTKREQTGWMLVVSNMNLSFDFSVFSGNVIDTLSLKIESNTDKVDSWLRVFSEYLHSWILGEWLTCSLTYENISTKLCLVIDNTFFEHCFMETLRFEKVSSEWREVKCCLQCSMNECDESDWVMSKIWSALYRCVLRCHSDIDWERGHHLSVIKAIKKNNSRTFTFIFLYNARGWCNQCDNLFLLFLELRCDGDRL